MAWADVRSYLDPWPWLQPQIPRKLAIESKRLSILYAVLILVVSGFLLWDLISKQAWYASLVPKEGGLALWRDPPTALPNLSVRHCTNPELYDFNYSQTWLYRPESCKVLAGNEAFRKRGSWLYIPTFSHDTTAWQFDGSADCNESAKAACLETVIAPIRARWHSASTSTCECVWEDEYFAASPELEHIVFSHDYSVPSPETLDLLARSMPSSIWDSDWGDTLSIVLKPDGSRCEVAGKTSWAEADTAQGIGTSLKEWMNCAGIDLDSNPNVLPQQSVGAAPHLRTMGFYLDFRLVYLSRGSHAEAHDGVVCYIYVAAHAAWNTNVEVFYERLPPFNEARARREMYMYGVTPRFQIEGTFRYPSYANLVSWLVEALVLIVLPAQIVGVVARYLLGVPSNIYQKECVAKLDIARRSRGAQARLLVYDVAFQILSGGKDKMDIAMFRRHLERMYETQLRDGGLDQEEFEYVLQSAFQELDTNDSGLIEQDEFMQAASSLEALQLEDIVHFLDEDRKRSIMEQIFDDTRLELKQTRVTSALSPRFHRRPSDRRTFQVKPAVEPADEDKLNTLPGIANSATD